MCVCVCVCVCIYIYIYIYIYIHVCLSICIYVCTYMYIYFIKVCWKNIFSLMSSEINIYIYIFQPYKMLRKWRNSIICRRKWWKKTFCHDNLLRNINKKFNIKNQNNSNLVYSCMKYVWKVKYHCHFLQYVQLQNYPINCAIA